MFSKMKITKYIENYSESIKKLQEKIETADAVVIGAGSGLSAAAGLPYSGERFIRYFYDFHAKYGINDIYSGGFYPYETLEEYWAWWSRHIYYNRYDILPGQPYRDLYALVDKKDYFIITTNVDHQFQLANFDKQRLFYTQGDYGLFQCSVPCHQQTYENETVIRKMAAEQKDMKIPTSFIPYCPKCGKPMSVNLRCDNTFVQNSGWYAAANRYEKFLHQHEGLHVLFLELGVGYNTPAIIKYPFWKFTAQNPKAAYACINDGETGCPNAIAKRSICIAKDIRIVLQELCANSIKKSTG